MLKATCLLVAAIIFPAFAAYADFPIDNEQYWLNPYDVAMYSPIMMHATGKILPFTCVVDTSEGVVGEKLELREFNFSPDASSSQSQVKEIEPGKSITYSFSGTVVDASIKPEFHFLNNGTGELGIRCFY